MTEKSYGQHKQYGSSDGYPFWKRPTRATHFLHWGPQNKEDAVHTVVWASQVSYLHKSDEEEEGISRSPDLFVQEPWQEGKDPVFGRARGRKGKIDEFKSNLSALNYFKTTIYTTRAIRAQI